MTKGSHLFPYRTQKLSPSVPKVLGWTQPGRIGRCRNPYGRSRKASSFFSFGRKKCGAFCGAEDGCGANGCTVAGDPQMWFELWKSGRRDCGDKKRPACDAGRLWYVDSRSMFVQKLTEESRQIARQGILRRELRKASNEVFLESIFMTSGVIGIIKTWKSARVQHNILAM